MGSENIPAALIDTLVSTDYFKWYTSCSNFRRSLQTLLASAAKQSITHGDRKEELKDGKGENN